MYFLFDCEMKILDDMNNPMRDMMIRRVPGMDFESAAFEATVFARQEHPNAHRIICQHVTVNNASLARWTIWHAVREIEEEEQCDFFTQHE